MTEQDTGAGHPCPAGVEAAGPLLAAAQAKLQVGPAHDPCEIEADAVARRISESLAGGPAGLPATDDDTGVAVRRAPHPGVGADGGAVDAATENLLGEARGEGRSLPAPLLRRMEDAFDSDFSDVRVHQGPRSEELNHRLGARAFTLGSDLFFRGAVPSTSSRADTELVAHELTHVVQQGSAARRVRRSFEPHNADFDEITEVKVIPQGRSNKGVYEIKGGGGKWLVVKFTDEKISGADKFADQVMGAVNIENRNVAAIQQSDARFTSLCDKLAAVGDKSVNDRMVQMGTRSALGVQVMSRVQGVDFGNQLNAAGTAASITDWDRTDSIAQGGSANFDIVGWAGKPAFVRNLGKLAVADVLIGNQDRFAIIMRQGRDGPQALPTFNPANFKVWGEGLIGAFDHDTLAYSYEVLEQHHKGVDPHKWFNPQTWVDTLIGGEDYPTAVGLRPMPALGGLFTDAGQQALYSEYIKIITNYMAGQDKDRVRAAMPEDQFCANLRKGYADALAAIAQKATTIRKAARDLSGGSDGTLDPEAIDVKLAFLQAKAQQVQGLSGNDLEAAMQDNAQAEKAARLTGETRLLISGKLFDLDPAYQQVPARPGKMWPHEKLSRKVRRTGRGTDEKTAQQIREAAQADDLSPEFLAKLDDYIKGLSRAGNDRRVQFALFELKLLKFIQYVNVQQARYMMAYRALEGSYKWSKTDLAAAKAADLAGKANGNLQALKNVGRQYETQLSGGDKAQKKRLISTLGTLDYPLLGIAERAKRLP